MGGGVSTPYRACSHVGPLLVDSDDDHASEGAPGSVRLRTFSIASVVIVNTLILVRNSTLIIRRRIQPAFAMWLFFTIAAGGSLLTYLSSGEFSLLDNIVNSTDIILVVTVTILIGVFGDKSTRLNAFDVGCLIAVLVICGFWLATRNHVLSHILIQAIMVIAYFPVVKRLWTTKRNSESYLAWIGLLLAPSLSLLSSEGLLATIYSVRAMVCTLALLGLMVRTDARNRRAAQDAAGAD